MQIGKLDIRPGWTTRVHVTDFQIANPDWARADHLVTLEEGEVAVKIWPLITGDMVFPEIRLREPDIALEKNAKGQTTWTFAADAESAGNAAPEDRGELPAIDELVIQDGSLSYRDAQRDLDVKGTIDTVKAAAAGDDAVNLSLDGTLQGRPVALDFTGGSMVRLRETEKPYPVDVEFKSGATTIRAEGTVTDPVQLSGLDIDLAIEGPTLGDIFPVIQVPLPDTPPYRLEGALGKEGERWRFDNFSGIVGDSDLSGSLYLDNGQKPPFVKADLLSNRLDFDDLAGLVGAELEEEKADTDGGLFPDEPIAADRLHAMNMDVSFNGTEVLAPNLPIEELKFRVQVTDGRALFRPLSLGVADGTVSGEAALNARQAVPSADADLTFERLNLKPFFEGTEFLREMGGRFSGHAYVLGVGRTVAEMADTARGEGAIAMQDGSISGLLVEAAGLDVAEALGLVVGGGDARIGIRCGRVNLNVDKGKVKIEQAVVDTTELSACRRWRRGSRGTDPGCAGRSARQGLQFDRYRGAGSRLWSLRGPLGGDRRLRSPAVLRDGGSGKHGL